MIGLYLNTKDKLKELTALRYIDMEGGEEPKIFPAAFINFHPINHEQLHQGGTQADITFDIRLQFTPYLRSEGNTPVAQLDKLADSMQLIEEVKTKLINEDIPGISSIYIIREHIQKKGASYEAPLTFKGRIEWNP